MKRRTWPPIGRPAPDGLEYTFHLKEGVKFHSGNDLTASDVVFSFNRFKTIGQGFAYLFDTVEECVADDDYTVRFVLAEPLGSFMGIIWHLYILDEETVMANIVDDGTYGGIWRLCHGLAAGQRRWLWSLHSYRDGAF